MGACADATDRAEGARHRDLHTTVMAKRKDAAASGSKQKQKPNEPLVDISEEEQWRIIRDSGVLKEIQTADAEADEDKPLLSPFTEECFAALSLIIPFCFLLLLMEM